MENKNEFYTKQILDAWKGQLGLANKRLEALTDEQLMQEVAPTRNSGLYILGHLTAVHDNMFTLLGLGEKLHPELEEVFLKNPDKSSLQKPSAKHLRDSWKEVNTSLTSKLEGFTPDQLLERHTAVSEEDFKKEPHRNKLNIVISRTGHLAYHVGQLTLLKK